MPLPLDSSANSYTAQLFSLIQERQHFLVTSHARPDGDAIGSALGLMHLLDAMGKRVDVAFADPIPAAYRDLPGVERIWAPAAAPLEPPLQVSLQAEAPATLPPGFPDAVILLECDSIERTGFSAIPGGFTINIDHHQSGRNFADWNWIDPGACAVGAMIYDFAVACHLPLNSAAATCLYAAVLTDTGSFTFPCTTSATFALAGHLLECGAEAHEVAEAVYFSNPESKVRILGAALSRMIVEDSLAWTVITLADIRSAHATVSDCEGVVNYLIGIAGVRAAVVFRELPGQLGCRASLRGKGTLDVAEVAEGFGGGGHYSASGCTLSGSGSSTMDAVLTRLRAAVS